MKFQSWLPSYVLWQLNAVHIHASCLRHLRFMHRSHKQYFIFSFRNQDFYTVISLHAFCMFCPSCPLPFDILIMLVEQYTVWSCCYIDVGYTEKGLTFCFSFRNEIDERTTDRPYFLVIPLNETFCHPPCRVSVTLFVYWLRVSKSLERVELWSWSTPWEIQSASLWSKTTLMGPLVWVKWIHA
jgi:hypothetical protein